MPVIEHESDTWTAAGSISNKQIIERKNQLESWLVQPSLKRKMKACLGWCVGPKGLDCTLLVSWLSSRDSGTKGGSAGPVRGTAPLTRSWEMAGGGPCG